MFLQGHVVVPGRGNHLLVVDVSQARDFPDRSSVTPQLIGVNDLWNIVFTQEASQEGLRRFCVTVPLKEDTLHEAVLVDGSPEPVTDAIDARTDLVQKPAGTPPGFPLAQVFREERTEVDLPFAQRLVTDLDGALMQ